MLPGTATLPASFKGASGFILRTTPDKIQVKRETAGSRISVVDLADLQLQRPLDVDHQNGAGD